MNRNLNYVRKLIRLRHILKAEPELTDTVLAKRFNVSRKTIYRYKATLNDINWDIEKALYK